MGLRVTVKVDDVKKLFNFYISFGYFGITKCSNSEIFNEMTKDNN